MKTNIKLGLIVGLIAPLAASAQLINPGVANTTTVSGGNIFHNTIIAMNNDVGALADGESDGVDYDINGLHLVQETTFYWNGVEFSDSFNGLSTFTQLDNSLITGFKMGDSLNIGYLGNESEDDNELYITAASDQSNSPALTETLINRLNGTPALFDYDAGDPNSTDDPPMSYSMGREAGYTGDIFFEVWHDNLSRAGTSAATQQDIPRFKIWEETNNGTRTGNYLLAISDRNRNFDIDGDDGFFLLGGDVTPVPEPSQIAALAMVGLGGFLFVRRRLAKNRK